MKVSKVLEAIQAELQKPLPEPRVVSNQKERRTKMAKKKGKQVEDEVEDEDLDEEEEEEEEDTDEDGEEEDEKPSKKSKSKGKDKKAAKGSKDSKKGKKSKAKGSDDGLVSIQDLADEAGINAQSARVKLREAELGKPDGGRWKWKEGSKDLKAARKALGL